jgi:cytoskeletal protein RodZ
MQNIGDRLAEARKRLGIALREASEATKIRTDYLQSMENGTFDFSLPEVYKRGFLKIYANYLKLDASKLADDYTNQVAGGGRGDRENLGRVEAPGGLGSAGAVPRERETTGDYDNSRNKSQADWVPVGAVVVVVVVVIGILIFGFNHLLQSGTSADEGTKTANSSLPSPAPAASAPAPAPAPAPIVPATPALNKFNFFASGDITKLTITDDAGQQLFNGPLKKGKSLPLTVKGRVAINVTQTQFLSIQLNNGQAESVADQNRKPVTGPLYFYWPAGAQQ